MRLIGATDLNTPVTTSLMIASPSWWTICSRSVPQAETCNAVAVQSCTNSANPHVKEQHHRHSWLAAGVPECMQRHHAILHQQHNTFLGLLQGYNGTVLAYGQTGAGKTLTMSGGKGIYGNSEKGEHPIANIQCKQPQRMLLLYDAIDEQSAAVWRCSWHSC